MRHSSLALVFVVLAVLIVSPLGTSYSAPIPDPGNPDSVIIDLMGAKRFPPGITPDNDSLWVAVIVVNDEEVMTGTIPIFYESPDDYWILDTALFTSDRWTAGGIIPPPESVFLEDRFNEDPDTTKFMLWFLGIFQYLQPGRDTMCIIHFIKNPAASTPSGDFKMGFSMVEEGQELGFVEESGGEWIPVMAMTSAGGYVTPPGSIPTDVVDITGEDGVPDEYTLFQNYPNPFNARTQIEFALHEPGQVKLEIFNILGQKVATPVDEYLTVGLKRVSWDGTDADSRPVASGMYFYRLITGDFVGMKKMVLMK